MNRVRIDNNVWPLIESVIIIGTEIEGRANFLACSWHSRVNQDPPLWGVTIDKRRYSLEGIQKNKTFSINVPGRELVRESDFVGIYSGRRDDKSALFTLEKGTIDGAPMICECMISLQLALRQIIEFETDFLIVGETVNAVSDDRYLDGGRIDFDKTTSFFLTYPDFTYRVSGETIGRGWRTGKKQ